MTEPVTITAKIVDVTTYAGGSKHPRIDIALVPATRKDAAGLDWLIIALDAINRGKMKITFEDAE